jgi:hypothetical protein
MGILEGSSLGYNIGYKVLDWRFQIFFRIANEIYQRITILYKIELEYELGLHVALF